MSRDFPESCRVSLGAWSARERCLPAFEHTLTLTRTCPSAQDKSEGRLARRAGERSSGLCTRRRGPAGSDALRPRIPAAPRYEPRQALALLAALCVSAGTSAGLTLGVKVALLRAHAPPAALERLAQSIDDTAAADDDPSGHETILSADAALAIAFPLLFGSHSEVPFDLKTRHDPFIWLGLPHVLSTGTQPSSVIAPSVIVPSLRYLESRRPARALVECCSCAPSWSSPRAACSTCTTASTSTRPSCATRRR